LDHGLAELRGYQVKSVIIGGWIEGKWLIALGR
jgi:hypothetical protein